MAAQWHEHTLSCVTYLFHELCECTACLPDVGAVGYEIISAFRRDCFYENVAQKQSIDIKFKVPILHSL